jgi:hypothetical protein
VGGSLDDLREQFEKDPWPVVGFLTTEHNTLISLRSASISESSSRVSAYLTTLSASLVTLGFVASSGEGFSDSFFRMGAVLLGVLTALGMVTFQRCLQTSVEDIRLARRIELLRATYLDLAPGLQGRLREPEAFDFDSARKAVGMSTRGHWQLLLTLAGLVSVINAVVLGAFAAFVAQLLGAGGAVDWTVGVVVALVHLAAQTTIQSRAFESMADEDTVAELSS